MEFLIFQIDSFQLIRISDSNSSEGCVLKFDLQYLKKLWELHNYYPATPDKIEIKKDMLPDYQLKIAYLYNIPNSMLNN